MAPQLSPNTATTSFATVASVLAATASALALWYAVELAVDTSPVQPDMATAGAGHRSPRGIPTAQSAVAPLTTYRGTLDRPLFAPDRRPPPPPQAAETRANGAAVDPPPADGLRIVGFMKGSGGKVPARALVRAADASQAVWVEAGSTIGGWRVAAVGDRTVTLESGGQRRELKLFETAPEPPERN